MNGLHNVLANLHWPSFWLGVFVAGALMFNIGLIWGFRKGRP